MNECVQNGEHCDTFTHSVNIRLSVTEVTFGLFNIPLPAYDSQNKCLFKCCCLCLSSLFWLLIINNII